MDADEYVATAVALIRDREKQRMLRSGMRERMRNPPLMDVEGFARRVEGCDRWMRRKWCERGVGGVSGRGGANV